jgi:hypothetical protein
LKRARLAVAIAVLAVAGGSAAPASAHEVDLLSTDMDLGVRDFNGYVWTVEVKGRVNCSGAERTHMGITLEMMEQYTQVGGGAVVAAPAPNTWHTENVMLPPGVYRVRFGSAVCQSTQDTPEGHVGDHGEGAVSLPTATLKLPDCRRQTRRPVTPAMRAPLVPLVGDGTDMRMPCPARMCDVLASGSSRLPLVPVGGGTGMPTPCPTIAVSRANVPVEIVCGPGSMAARRSPIVPVGSRGCAGRVDLVGLTAGVANASASRVIGTKRFRMRPGTVKSIGVRLKPTARRTLNLTRVLRMRAVVRSNGKVKKSKPFTVFKRG